MSQLNEEETIDCRLQDSRTWDAIKIASALMLGAAVGVGWGYLSLKGQEEDARALRLEDHRLFDATIDSIAEFEPNTSREEVEFEFLEGRREVISYRRVAGIKSAYLKEEGAYTLAILNLGVDGDYILMEYPEEPSKASQRARFIEAEGMPKNMFPYKGMDIVELRTRGKYRTVLQSNRPFPDYTKVWLAKKGKR